MIYTFYSYKGGVGRSMALANVAEILYRRGLKVLMVDFDLEAPGLERYFAVSQAVLSSDQIERRRGLIDLLVSYNALRRLLRPTGGTAEAQEPRVRSVISLESNDETSGTLVIKSLGGDGQSQIPEESSEPPFPVEPLKNFIHQIYAPNDQGGELFILPAGLRACANPPGNAEGEKSANQEEFGRYAERVRAFPWNDFYTMWEGQRFFDWFRKEATTFADVVLIDSRTGVTEMSGICTYHLAEVVVLFSAPNQQNLIGTKNIAASLNRPRLVTEGRKGRKLQLLFVPSRVDVNEKRELDNFARLFQDTLNHMQPRDVSFETNAFFDLKIPYVPFYSYREEVAVRDRDSPVALEMIKVYERISLTLAKLEPAGGKLRGTYDPKQIVAGNTAEQQNRFAEGAFSELKPAEQEAARPVLFRMVRLARRGEAVGDTRLRVNMEEFNEKSLKIVRRLADVGLLSIEKDEATSIQTVQLAQESYIANWDRLRIWLNKDREFLLWRQHLQTNIEQWNNSKRERAALLSGVSLADAKHKRDDHEQELTDLENLYIVESARYQTAKRIKDIVTVGVAVILVVIFVGFQWRQNQKKRLAAEQQESEKKLSLAEAIKNGDKSAQNEDNNSAMRFYTLALGLEPNSVEALTKRGNLNFKLARYDEALRDFDQVLKLRSDYPEVYSTRGLAYIKKYELDKAIADFTRAVQIKSDYAEAYYYRGYAYGMEGNTTAAIEDYTRAIDLKRDNYPEAFLARGFIYEGAFEKDKTDVAVKDKAVADLTKAITLTSIPGVRAEAAGKLGLLSEPSTELAPQPPQVFIHYNDLADENVIAPLAEDIGSAHFFVQGVQTSDGFTIGDIRYYYPEDKASAQKVREVVIKGLKSRGRELNIKLRFLGDYYKDVSRGSIEVWIPSLNALTSSGDDKNSIQTEPARTAPRSRRSSPH